MTAVIGHVAETLLAKKAQMHPSKLISSLGQLDSMADGVNMPHTIRLNTFEGHCSIHVDRLEKGTRLLAGRIEPFPGFVITERCVTFGDTLPASLKQSVLSETYTGQPLSRLISTPLRDLDPIIGRPEARHENGQTLIALPLLLKHKPWDKVRQRFVEIALHEEGQMN